MAPKRKGPQPEASRREKLTMELTPAQVKQLLGDNGALIRQLRAETTASLKVFDEPGSTPYVLVKGTIETVYAARDKIAAAISVDRVQPIDDSADPERTPERPLQIRQSREVLESWCRLGGEKLRESIVPISTKRPTELIGSLRCRLASNEGIVVKPGAMPKSTEIIGKVAPVASAIGGMSTGAVVGAVVGLPAALVTFGLSIPVCAATGGAVGGATGFYAGRKVEEALLGAKPEPAKPIVRTLSQLWEREEQERREERARRAAAASSDKTTDVPIPRTLSQLWELEIARREQLVPVEEKRVAKTWLELTAQSWLGGAGASWVGAAIPAKRTFIHYAERSGFIRTSASAPTFPRNPSDLSRGEASSPKLADLASRA